MTGHFFTEVVVASNAYDPNTPTAFGFRATSLMVVIDGNGPLEFSYNGKDRHGKLYKADKFIVFDDIDESQIFFRVPNGNNTSIRVWAWENQK